MINDKIKKSLYENKPLLLAILFSLILHLILLSNFLIHLPKSEDKAQVFKVSLVKLQPKPQATPQDSPKTISNTVPVQPIQPKQTPKIQPLTSIAKPLPVQAMPIATPQPSLEPTPITAPEVAIISEPQRHETDRNGTSPTANTQAYQYVETEFEIRQSADPEKITISTVTFTSQAENGTYSLTNAYHREAHFNQPNNDNKVLLETSEGIITNQGLKPNYYTQNLGDGQNKQTAIFAWGDGSVEVNNKYEKLSQGTQDEISYLYQFMYFPPTETTEITTTDGLKIYTHHFSYLGEEIIYTKFGEIKTIHLSKEGEEKIEVWLAVDYQYLPVKTKKTAVNGSFVEQTATKLTTNTPEMTTP